MKSDRDEEEIDMEVDGKELTPPVPPEGARVEEDIEAESKGERSEKSKKPIGFSVEIVATETQEQIVDMNGKVISS